MRAAGLSLIALMLAGPAAAAEHWRCHEQDDWVDYVVNGETLNWYHNDVIGGYTITTNSKRQVVAKRDDIVKITVKIDKRSGEISTTLNDSGKLRPSGSCKLTDGPIMQYGPPSH